MTLDEMLAAYDEAARANDIDKCAEMIADDAVYFLSNGGAYVGKAEIIRILMKDRDKIKGDTFHTEDTTWLARGADGALCVWRYAWTGEVDGKRVGGEGRGTTAYRRDGDKWLIVHQHLSPGAYRT